MRTLDRIDRTELEALLARGEFFWLDLDRPSDAELDELSGLLGWNALALEDVKEFGQRPKVDDYADHALLVFYGLQGPEERLAEVHLFVSGEWLVTVRRTRCVALGGVRERLSREPARTEEDLVYAVLDALTDSFLPFLTIFDERLDALEDAIVADPVREQLEEVIALRRHLGPIRRVAVHQRDMFISVGSLIDRLPGLERGRAGDKFRDVADHLARIADALDAFRDRLTTSLDLYASQNGNRLNEVTERLTLVATIFLPLSFIVGFFGQNFSWLTDHIHSFHTFVIYGVGGLVVPLLIMFALFARAGWLRRR